MKRYGLTRSALLVIDMQRYFLTPGASAYLAPPRTLVPNVLSLISAFRTAGRPVVFTRHAHRRGDAAGQMGRWWRGKLPMIDDPESELIPEIAPARGELIVIKQRYSAFEGTTLHGWLGRRRIEGIAICGVMTNLCVETTARHAFMKDYQPVVVADACAASNRRFQSASIANLEYGFAFIAKTSDAVGALGRTL